MNPEPLIDQSAPKRSIRFYKSMTSGLIAAAYSFSRWDMAPFVPNKKATFFWQGALIILPVVILAGVGFFSLRQDKVLARHEAEQRA